MQLYWLSTAKSQRINLIDYILINNDSVEIAVQVNESIDEDVDILEDNPNLGKPGRHKNTREWVHPQYGYIVVYRIMSKRIEILNILPLIGGHRLTHYTYAALPSRCPHKFVKT